jgi:hypothetical protein
MKTRRQLESLYGDEQTEDGKLKATKKNRELSPEELRQRKKQILEQLRQDYGALKQNGLVTRAMIIGLPARSTMRS